MAEFPSTLISSASSAALCFNYLRVIPSEARDLKINDNVTQGGQCSDRRNCEVLHSVQDDDAFISPTSRTNQRTGAGLHSILYLDCSQAISSLLKCPHKSEAYRQVAPAVG